MDRLPPCALLERLSSYVVQGLFYQCRKFFGDQIFHNEFHFPNSHVFIFSVSALHRTILVLQTRFIIDIGCHLVWTWFALVVQRGLSFLGRYIFITVSPPLRLERQVVGGMHGWSEIHYRRNNIVVQTRGSVHVFYRRRHSALHDPHTSWRAQILVRRST